jgi:uncharacterized damage-inducible protein DinB
MNVSDIRTLYAYNRWANLRMFSVLEKLTPQQFTAPHTSSFPSIHETVFHLLAAEWIWLKRWQGTPPRATQPVTSASIQTWKMLRVNETPAPQRVETLADLRDLCDAVEAERNQLLAGLSEERLHAPLAYHDMSGVPYSMPLAELMQHVVNHGTYHRGQVTTLLREAGAETIGLDMVYYFRERQQQASAGQG